MTTTEKSLLTFGWREWVSLPDLGIQQVKAKIDTGARTSSLHAFEITPFMDENVQKVRFRLHPRQRDNDTEILCTATVIDERRVTDSGGHGEDRWVIRTPLSIGGHEWPIEMTLTSRDNMLFRMLIGRTAMRGRVQVDPSRSYLVGKRRRKAKKTRGKHS